MPKLDLDDMQARATAYRNSAISRIDINCDELISLIDRLRKAETRKPVAVFEGYIDGQPIIKWVADSAPVGTELFAAPLAVVK